MMKLSQIIFFVFLAAIFILEGTGLSSNFHMTTYYLILIAPAFLFILNIFNQRKLIIPKKLSLLFFVFFLLAAASTLFSVNVQKSFELLLFYLAVFLIFLYVFNQQDQLRKFIIPLIFILSAFFSLYSLFINFFLRKGWFFLAPKSSYNFIYPIYPSHNLLGDLLVLPTVISFYFFFIGKRRRLAAFSAVFFLIFLILSYSRSAYLAVVVTIIMMYLYLKAQRKIKDIFLATAILIALIITISSISFLIISDIKKPFFLSQVRNVLVANFGLRDKNLIAGRDQYLWQAWRSIGSFPLLGVGPNNFIYASRRGELTANSWAATAHNLTVEILVEDGILAGTIFFLIVILMLINTRKTYIFFGFLALLVNFQTYYAYTFYSVFLIFFILGALIYDEKEKGLMTNSVVLLTSLLLFLISVLMLAEQIFYKRGDYKLAWYLYPLDQNIYQPLIEEDFKKGQFKTGLKQERLYLGPYEKLFSGDPQALFYIGREYLVRYNQKQKAENFFQQAVLWDPNNKILRQRIEKLIK